MAFSPQVFTEIVDLSSTETKKVAANQLIALVNVIINGVVEAVLSNNFDFSQHSFEKKRESGLTKNAGFYLIINKRNCKFYLGSSADLAQRKGEHHQAFTKKPTNLPTAMRNDLNTGAADDFCYVPLLFFPLGTIQGITGKGTAKQQVSAFIDTWVEQPLLEVILQSSEASSFYNVKAVSTFVKGNRFGGAPNSGQPPAPCFFETYAWASVSAAAASFEVDRKSIRNKMFAMTIEDFNNFPYVKITTETAPLFAVNYPTDYVKILTKLFPIAARNRKVAPP
jgi:hypothetical protein